MTRILDRRKAIALREQGKTYSEIRKELNLSKSTLSDWLSGYDLSKEQLDLLKKRIKNNKELAVEKFRLCMRKKKEKRLEIIYKDEKKNLLPLSLREIYFSGLFLYWGEGNKSSPGGIVLSNSDPRILRFFLFWITNCLKVSKEKVKVYIHLYSDMDINSELEYWKKKLNIPRTQFAKPYIKTSKRADIDQKGLGHGTCNLVINSVRLKERVMKGIDVISDCYTCET